MDKNKAAAESPCDELNFERSLAELEAIVHELEEGQLGLADALARYEQGVKHLQRCYKLLEAAERKIELLTSVAADGTPTTKPFAESGESSSNAAGGRKRGKQAASDATKDDIGA